MNKVSEGVPKVALGKDTMLKHLPPGLFVPSRELMKVPGVTWDGVDRCHWHIAICEGEVLGCVGTLIMNNKARFRTDVVLPEHRGKGIYSLLFMMRQYYAVAINCTEATAFSNRNSRPVFLKNGFIGSGKETSGGVLYMRKVFDKPIKNW